MEGLRSPSGLHALRQGSISGCHLYHCFCQRRHVLLLRGRLQTRGWVSGVDKGIFLPLKPAKDALKRDLKQGEKQMGQTHFITLNLV